MVFQFLVYQPDLYFMFYLNAGKLFGGFGAKMKSVLDLILVEYLQYSCKFHNISFSMFCSFYNRHKLF